MSRADLPVRRGLVIPGSELRELASRAGGPGGQRVNKVSTRVSLRWNLARSAVLTDSQRARLLEKLRSRITRGGELVVHAGRFRVRVRNQELARERLAELVRSSLARRPARRATKRPRASVQRSLSAKRKRGALKRTRGPVRGED